MTPRIVAFGRESQVAAAGGWLGRDRLRKPSCESTKSLGQANTSLGLRSAIGALCLVSGLPANNHTALRPPPIGAQQSESATNDCHVESEATSLGSVFIRRLPAGPYQFAAVGHMQRVLGRCHIYCL
eukprot:scaffold1471_cov413-Prasinococcus_capsulatus_cf.AAC.16